MFFGIRENRAFGRFECGSSTSWRPHTRRTCRTGTHWTRELITQYWVAGGRRGREKPGQPMDRLLY